MGMSPMARSIAVGENHGGVKVAGKPEPLFMDSEPKYEVQSYEAAVEQDCRLAEGIVYVSTDGELGCVIVHDLDGGGEGENQGQTLPMITQVPPTAE